MNGYTYNLYSTGLFYPDIPCFVDSSELANKQGFASLYSVNLDTAQAIKQAATQANYKGLAWSQRLWIDVDTKGLSTEEAIDRLNLAEARLKEMGLDYIAYDSGGHPFVGGGHFGILRDTEPSHVLPAQDRAWVKKHFGDIADLSIYTHLHLFRLPGTVHQTTGRTKVLVGKQAGKVLTLPPLVKGEPLLTEFGNENTEGGKSIFANFNIMANIGPRKNGERHAALVKLAFELRDHGVGPNQALWLLQENNKLFNEPKPDAELEKIIKDLYGT